MVPKATKECTNCGVCAAECLVQAIDKGNPKKVDEKACISCMRCITACPQGARKLNPVMLSAASLKKNDVAVLISYSGETYDIIRMASLVKRTGCKLIAITSYTKNSLSKFADVILYTVSAETMIRSGAISSRIAQLTVIDALYTAVCSNMYDSVKSQLDKTSRVASMARPDQTERFLQESRQTDN